MLLFDSHCHIDKLSKVLSNNINNLIFFLKKNKIKYLLAVSVNMKNFFNILSMLSCINQNIIKLSCGIHPLYINKDYKNNLLYLKKNILNDKVIAIGECGLDYFNSNNLDKKKQIYVFNYHLYLCQKYIKPCIIHTRLSYTDTFNIIKNLNNRIFNIILHCYNYFDKYILYNFLNLGMYISLSGLITFKNNLNLQNIIKYIPIDRLLIETDSPYLSPHPYRGFKNNPSRIIFIIKKISILKKISYKNVLKNTKSNFLKLFNF